MTTTEEAPYMETGIPVRKIHTETVAITTGETLATTTTEGAPLYAASGPSQPLNAATVLFLGTEDDIRDRLPKKSSLGHKLQIQTFKRSDGFRKFYDNGQQSHIVLLLRRNTTRIAEFDDPLGFFFHRTRLGRVSLVFVGENDRENFAALCELDPNISAINDAGRVFFWDELEGTSKQKIDDLMERIKDAMGMTTTRKVIPRQRGVLLKDRISTLKFDKLQALLAALAVAAVLFSLLCSFPPIEKHAKVINVPGSERWTQAERASYMDAQRNLEMEKMAAQAERRRIDGYRRKMIEKLNEIEELENNINREKRIIVCGLLERREGLLQEFSSSDHAERHIAELRREVNRLESTLSRIPAGGREHLELARSINEKKYDVRVWEEGLAELRKVEDELARSDVFAWSEMPDYCEQPNLITAH